MPQTLGGKSDDVGRIRATARVVQGQQASIPSNLARMDVDHVIANLGNIFPADEAAIAEQMLRELHGTLGDAELIDAVYSAIVARRRDPARIVRRTTEAERDYMDGFSEGVVETDVTTISTAREDYDYCSTTGALMVDDDGNSVGLLFAYRCLTCGGMGFTRRKGVIRKHFSRADQIVLLRRLGDVWATWPVDDLSLLLQGAAMVDVPELMAAIAEGKRKNKFPIGAEWGEPDEPRRLGSASDYPTHRAEKLLDTLYRNKPKFAGQSGMELAHHEATARLFGTAESGRTMKDRGMSRSSWNVDIYTEFADQKIVIEYDGRYWHDSEAQIAVDVRKSNDLLDVGYVVVRLREPGLEPLAISHPRYREFAAKRNDPRKAELVIADVYQWVCLMQQE
jgi:hypothetical protein